MGEINSAVERVSVISERPPYVKILIYGDPGVGKTVLAAAAPNPLILDTEKGSRSLLNHPELRDVSILKVNSWADVEDILWEFRDEDSEFAKKFDTIVIDSLSELQRRQLDEILKRESDADKSGNRNPYIPFQLDYKENTEILRRMVNGFSDLEKHLILTAHAKEEKDESSGRLFWRPQLTPKLTATLEGIMDLQGFMTLDHDKDGKEIRKLQVMPSNRVKAKTRIGGLPPVIEEPTFQIIMEANQNWDASLPVEEEFLQEEEVESDETKVTAE